MARNNRVNHNVLNDRMFKALVISLLIHGFCFGTWKIGESRGWWRQNQFSAWIQKLGDHLLPMPKLTQKKTAATDLTREIPLTFIEVDPSLSVDQADDAKFYGAANTKAASPKKAESELPQIEGKQDKVLKTTENNKPIPKPLEPTPLTPDVEEKIAEQDNKKESEARPETKAPGDLALAKPAEREESGKQDAKKKEKAKAKETRKRPRTLAEVKTSKQSGSLGEQMRHDGGSPQVAMSSSLSVKQTALGGYDARLIAAVKHRWYDLLEQINSNSPGKVVLQFNLHPDGRVSDVIIQESEVSEMLGLICKQAILDPAPYGPWTTEMRHELNGNIRPVTFTFYYLTN